MDILTTSGLKMIELLFFYKINLTSLVVVDKMNSHTKPK
jgi:hypothetical protein